MYDTIPVLVGPTPVPSPLIGITQDTVCAGIVQNFSTPATGNSFQWFITGGTILSGQGTNGVQVQWDNTQGLSTLRVREYNLYCEYSDTIRVFRAAQGLSLIPPLLTVCPSEPVTITAPGWLNSWLWSTGATTQSITTTNGGLFLLIGTGPGGCTLTDTTEIQQTWPDCVWPGDADDDNVADGGDLLALGLMMGQMGDPRPNANLNWYGQRAGANWPLNLGTGVNAKYCDTDGDGEVTLDDTLAVSLNWGLTHPKTCAGGQSLPLRIVPTQSWALTGDTLTAEIWVGSAQWASESLHGISFVLNLNPSQFVPQSFRCDLHDSWLLPAGDTGIRFYRAPSPGGQFPVVVSRVDLQDTSAWGLLGTLRLKLAGSVVNGDSVKIFASDALGLNAYGDTLYFQPEPGVWSIGPRVDAADAVMQGLSLYPNPARTEVWLRSAEPMRGTLRILTLQGQEVLRRTGVQTGEAIALPDLPAGMYLAELWPDHSAAPWRTRLELVR